MTGLCFVMSNDGIIHPKFSNIIEISLRKRDMIWETMENSKKLKMIKSEHF